MANQDDIEGGSGSEDLYRLRLLEKLKAAEEDVREGRVLDHEEVVAETAKWFEAISEA
jgi:hypothetical protein